MLRNVVMVRVMMYQFIADTFLSLPYTHIIAWGMLKVKYKNVTI